MSKPGGWIGVDLDGTLAFYEGWQGIEHIGEPVPLMLERVKCWLKQGRDVRIFTARVDGGGEGTEAQRSAQDVALVRGYIERWCEKHVGQKLEITNRKDFGMVALWDDRCVQVEPNTGRRMDRHPEE